MNRERPREQCHLCKDWGSIPDAENRGQYKPCPEPKCQAARKGAAAKSR
ncbi:hypothetical protein [Kitasatospora terrestris]|uniref:Uncharacterized protein n=1 Tax=Kitasatospora terrestris TaxID=258051 RepID=A0ABP9E286_9ACTN